MAKTRRVLAELTESHMSRLEVVLTTCGLGFSDWLRAMIDRCAEERLPESQGDVKKIIPAEIARDSRVALEQIADFYLMLSKKSTDRLERSRLRKLAAPYLDAADFFSSVLEERRKRQHVLESGQREARHRRKGSESPATDSSSRTTVSPTG
jgi:chlorite dismutase